jgi:hypothetical protein
MADAGRGRVKRARASLIGGIAVGAGVLVLWLLIAGEATPGTVASGALVAAALGAWVRLADL